VSIDVVHALFEVVEKAGVSRLELLREAKLEGHELRAGDARVTRGLVYWLCERAMELTGDASLGLHWAETISGNTFAPVSPLIAHSANLRQAFESLSRFDRLLTDEAGYQLLERNERVIVRCVSLVGESPRTQRLVAEMIVAGMFKLMQTFSVDPRKVQVNFTYPAPSYRAEYTRVFMGAERFDQPFTGLEFERTLMNAVSRHKDDDVHSALRSVAERRLLRLTQRTPFAVRVRELLVQRGAAGRTDMNAIAGALGLSVRTLRRRLCAEGKPYRAVVNDALAIVAKHQLRSTLRTIQEIAHELGFSDASTFHRAFKRRTGMTPQAYRERQLSSDNPD
jgi:AraC-like DNA-binding protein